MSDVTESSSSTHIVTVHTESSTNLPMGFKLNGSNYEIWASMIELHATTQGKLGYLTSNTDAPDSQDPKFGKWKIAEAIATFMVDRVYDFLAGLDYTYDKVRSDILQSDKVPSIENVFFMVRRKAQCQITMLGSDTKIREPTFVFASKNTALVFRPIGFGSFAVLPHRLTSAEKDKLKRLKREQLDSKAHVAVAPTSLADITTGHGHLTATPSPILTAVLSTPTPHPPSNFCKAFHAHDTRDTGWIIDSGATDHMMYNSTLFFTTISPHHDHVMNANNATAVVTGADSILLTHALPLDKVLLDIQSREILVRGGGGVVFILWMMWQLVRFFVLEAPKLLSITEFGCYIADLNGVAERKNGQILAAARVLLLGTDSSYLYLFYSDSVSKGVWLCRLCSPPSESEERNRGVPPDHYSPEGKARYAIAHYVSDHKLSPECKAFVTRMDSIKIPTRVEEAFNDPKWAEAMNIEMEVLQKNNTWDIVDLPKGTKPYVMDLLADTRMLDCKLADTPIVENHKLGVYVD
ncbi:unnamed protein product [Prunus brigantina]